MDPTRSASPAGAEESVRLYLAIGRLWRTLRQDAPEAAIGHGSLSTLATLILDGPQRPGALAQAEGVSAPAMTRIVTFLESQGYVERRPDPADGRASVVVATADGEAQFVQGRASRLHALQERFARLDDDQRQTLLAAVAALESLSDPVERA